MLKETYTHKFGNGIKVKAVFALTETISISWTGTPTMKIVDEYLAWKDKVYKMLSKRHEMRLIDKTLGQNGKGIERVYENGVFLGFKEIGSEEIIDHVGNGDCK